MTFKLKVRGIIAAVGSYDHCVNVVMHRWGWVPMRFAGLLKVELEPA